MTSGLFGAEMWNKLQDDPETAGLLADPSFQTIINDLRSDPSALGRHISDPRVLKLFTALSKTSTPAKPAENVVVEDATASSKPDVTMREAPKKPQPQVAEVPQVDYDSLSQKDKAAHHKALGTVAYKKREFETAIAEYSKAYELDDANMSYLTNRAAAKLENADIDGAIADCQLAIDENTNRGLRTDFKIIARAYGRMGNAYLKKEDYDGAIRAFEKSLVEYSDNKISVALRETRRIKKKKEEEAYIDADLSQKVRKEGNELFLAGKFPESIEKYTEAIKRNPKDAAPYSNRAAAYMKLGEFPMAMKDCDRCLENDPKFVKAYIRKGNIHFFMKDYYKSLKAYEDGMKLAPNNKELRNGLMKTNMKIQEMQNGEVDQQQMQQAMKDPEIQTILQDPHMQTVLKQMQDDPRAAAKIMQDPEINDKVTKLVAAGILRVG